MPKFYTIRPGDTLQTLALNGKTTVQALLELNPTIADPNVIYSGQTILLPDQVSRKDLIAAKADALHPGISEPSWLKVARGELGQVEIGGAKANPRIVEYLWTTQGLSMKDRNSDETAWCSAFVNWCFQIVGIKGTGSAWALHWKDWGQAIEPGTIGGVAVFSRRGSGVNGGHVGFYLDETDTKVRVLGGNQGNAVSVASYPKDGRLGSFDYRYLGCRTPT